MKVKVKTTEKNKDFNKRVVEDLKALADGLDVLNNYMTGKHTTLDAVNETRDDNITELQEQVSALKEEAAKQDKDSESGNGAVKARMDEFVKTELGKLVEAEVRKIMAGKELTSKVNGVVKTLLGHKGSDGVTRTAKQMDARGRIAGITELQEKQMYRVIVQK